MFERPSAVTVSSGSAALEVVLRVADVTGERVTIPVFACAHRVLRVLLDWTGTSCEVGRIRPTLRNAIRKA